MGRVLRVGGQAGQGQDPPVNRNVNKKYKHTTKKQTINQEPDRDQTRPDQQQDTKEGETGGVGRKEGEKGEGKGGVQMLLYIY